MHRTTLMASTLTLSGVGLHSGLESWVKIYPSPESEIGKGIQFRSVSDSSTIPISQDSVISTSRCTTISVGSKELNTVEHLISALSGLGITDAIVEFDGIEVPILDGSANEFVLALKQAGIQPTDVKMLSFRPAQSIVAEGDGGSSISAIPADRFSVSVVIEYPDRPDIRTQAAFYSGDYYASEIAPARTYGFLSELEYLTSKGLASGASFENCIALTDSGAADSRTPLRFENELARHKLLDVIGDLALTGIDIQAHIVAVKPSHTVNSKLARLIAEKSNGQQA